MDHGGNCVGLFPSPDGHANNLHAFWDSTVVRALGASPDEIAGKLEAQITPAQAKAWSRRDAADWDMESFALAQRDVYALVTHNLTFEQYREKFGPPRTTFARSRGC